MEERDKENERRRGKGERECVIEGAAKRVTEKVMQREIEGGEGGEGGERGKGER